MRSRGKWMGLKAVPEMGNVKCANCVDLTVRDDL